MFFLPLLGPQGAQVRPWNLTGGPHRLTFSSGTWARSQLVFLAERQPGSQEGENRVFGPCGGTEWFEEMVYEGKPVQTVLL